MGNVVSDNTCCTISGKDFNDPQGNKALDEFWQCCDRNNCCVGQDACALWSDEKDASYTICKDACNGFGACNSIAVLAEKSGPEVKINQGACDGPLACAAMSITNNGKIEIGTKSCVGNAACSFLGADIEKESITVEWSSCIGDLSCSNLGISSSKGVDVGYLSCLGERACFFFGSGHEQTTIESGVCVFGPDSECFECAFDIRSQGGEDPLIAQFFPPFFCPYN